MRVHERMMEAVQAAKSLSFYGKYLPSKNIIADLERKKKELDRLLPETMETEILQGILEQIKPLVHTYLKTGTMGELESPRYLRVLCYYLDSKDLSEPTLLESDKFIPILQILDNRWKDSFLTPLILLILKSYGLPDVQERIDKYLSPLVRKHLPAYSGKRPVPLAAQRNQELIFHTDPVAFATRLIYTKKEWFSACESAEIPARMLGTSFFGIALIEFISRSNSTACYLDDSFLSRIKEISSPDLLKSLLAYLIEQHGKDSAMEPALTAQAFKYIGDPMVISRWRCGEHPYIRFNSMLGTAREKVLEWINKQVLGYFFEKAEMDGGRKEFWNKYTPKMQQIRIAMYRSSFSGFQTSNNPDLDKWLEHRLIRIRSSTQGIGLVMEYGDWVIVEFGSQGNACYFYRKDNPFLRDLDKGINSLSYLKQTYLNVLNYPPYDGEGRFIHSEGWEYKLKKILRFKVGL